MATKLFAAIDVGSYELNLKIVEFGPNGMREVDAVRYRLDLGTDTFSTGKVSIEKVDELCRIIGEFAKIMKSYHVTEYRAYGTSAIRETKNTHILIDQIEQRTGIRIDVISNSEQRFLDYKSVASKGDDFDKTIGKGTAIIDIGGGSIQISLFDNDKLDVTQNMKLGVLRLRERLNNLAAKPSRHGALLDEMIGAQLSVFDKLYLKNRKIENLIIVDDYISPITLKRTMDSDTPGFINAERFEAFFERLKVMNAVEFSRKYSVALENISLVFVSAQIIRSVIALTGAKTIWCPGVSLCEGIAYEYGESKKLLVSPHDFEEDIVACARNIGKRYMSDDKRSQTLESICMTIFDAMKKRHGLTERDRLLLRISTILHDCGKYISLYNLATCSYDIIMSTEIIGLSHAEREIVANVVKFNHRFFDYDATVSGVEHLGEEAYMKIAKLTAILRVANGLDKSQKQKFGCIKATLKDDVLTITVRTNKDITYERGMFEMRADFFEEVFCVRPQIKHINKL
ncbi:MAG: HD domain-containing protein [Lachnospiraceae bacterium]|nr:HD domain-containing protein [Candidatus Colinaster equi]